MKALFAALSCAALIVTLSPGQASGQEAAFDERVDVELVLVDVFVERKDGQPITDLTATDFRLYHDGKPVSLSQFSPARVAAQSTAVASASTEAVATIPTVVSAQPKQLILFLDSLHLHPNSRGRVIRALSDKLNGYLEPADEVMVVGYGGNAEVLLPMTRDRGALKRVLREQAESGAVSLLASYNDDRILQIIESRHSEETLNTRVAGDPCVDLGFIAHSHAEQVQGRVLSTISALENFVNSLAGYEGRKVLLHVSDGIPLVPGAEAYRYASELCDGTGAIKGIENAVDTATFGVGKNTRWDPTRTAATLQEFNTASEWTRLAGHANTYQVSFYTFQARVNTHRAGSVDGARTSYDTEFEGRRNKQDALYLLADETGGVAMFDAPDIEEALVHMAEDWQSGYQLAYEPPTPADGRQHKIRVEVDRPGVSVRHRKSYVSKDNAQRIADRVVSTLMHGESGQRSTTGSNEDNPLGVRVKVGDQQSVQRGLTNVKLTVRIPFEELVLLPGEGARQGLFTVFIAAQSEHGQLTPVGQKTVPLRVPLEGGEPAYLYTVEVPIWGDAGKVAVAVQDELSGEVSYLRERVRLTATS